MSSSSWGYRLVWVGAGIEVSEAFITGIEHDYIGASIYALLCGMILGIRLIIKDRTPRHSH